MVREAGQLRLLHQMSRFLLQGTLNVDHALYTVALVLAGGQGERLYPLTRYRAKPAVPFGGIYRILDFTLSNCLNSNLRRIHVLTQYKSHSLARHLQLAWSHLPSTQSA